MQPGYGTGSAFSMLLKALAQFAPRREALLRDAEVIRSWHF